jgi:hypothetical protein
VQKAALLEYLSVATTRHSIAKTFSKRLMLSLKPLQSVARFYASVMPLVTCLSIQTHASIPPAFS